MSYSVSPVVALARRGFGERPNEAVCRRNKRLRPGAEALEVRECPSGVGAAPGLAESAHAIRVAEVEARQVRVEIRHEAMLARHARLAEIRHEGLLARRHPKRPVKGAPSTIYVAPRGRISPVAGKNAAHPLGSLAVALKRAKNGSTIVLAPGTYTQAVGLMGKSGITIVGAANGSSVLAGAGAFALKVYSSSGITLQNLTIQAPSGSGLAVFGSSVNLVNVNATGNQSGGAVISGGGSVNATGSHFDASQAGDGMDVQNGTATVNGCTFNGNAGSSGGTGLSVENGSQVTIVNSEFVGNTNANLVAYNQAQVTATGSTFSGSHQGDGALFSGQVNVNLSGDTFSGNGLVRGYASGFNGIEFLHYTGAGSVTGSTFANNTANGIFVGGSSQTLSVTGNTFSGNLVGLNMDGSVGAALAVIQGNTFTTTANSGDQGLVADGSNVNATIGGTGNQANTFANYAYQRSILQYNSSGTSTVGCPVLTIQGNVYTINGVFEDSSQAILPC